jgi:sigma-B regulation protein RsbU (phosphoserine phosphatase)
MKRENILGSEFLFSVRTKILLVFLALSLTALLITGYLAFSQMGEVSRFALESNKNLGFKAGDDSATALENDARTQLLRLAKDQAYISNIIFERVGSETEVMALYALDIISDPQSTREKRFYLQNEKPEDPYSTSVLYLAPGVKDNIPIEERNSAGMMDKIFIPIYNTDPDLEGVYIGTASGMTLVYPWTDGLNSTFDPRLRDWYIKAEKTGNLTWSEPYIDLLGNGLMVTCSKPIYNSENSWVWVIGADVTIETINQNIIGTQIGDRGYAMLIDENGDVITRPGLSAGDKRWDESFVTENLLLSDNKELVSTAEDMIKGNIGVTRVTFDDGDRFIAYAPVVSVNWSVGLVLPVDEVIAPAHATKNKILQASEDTAFHISQQQETMKTFFIVTFLGVLGIVCLLTFFFSRLLTRPLLELQKGSQAIGQGDLDYKVVVSSRDEFGALARSFNAMAADLKEYISTLRRTTAERERMLRELEIAKGIQQSFLPDCAPELTGFDLEGYNLPAAEVGGDFYDFIPVGDENWGLVIADVAGKGVPAALFMALSRTLIRASASGIQDPSESIIDANRHICLDSKASMFVTLFYAILDTRKHSLTFINAGHNPPFILGKEGSSITLLKAEGIALGVIDDIDLESVEVQLKPGDVVVLYTDGVTEATNDINEEYGVERLTNLATRLKEKPAKEIIEAIVEDVTAFALGRPQFDDITIMVLKDLG